MRTICCWSGGKDSTASIILAHLHNIPIDYIVFVEVMFDKKKKISGENPEHMKFIKRAIRLFNSWGYKCIVLRAEDDYLSLFHKVIKKPRKHMEHAGMKRGFPLPACYIRRDCKMKPIEKFIRKFNEPVMQIVGICADEKSRLESMHKDPMKVSLLENFGYTEKMAMELCEKHNLLSPTYKYSNRGGCWMCPFAKIEEHLAIRNLEPDAWNMFLSLEEEENVAASKWSIYNGTLREREEMFRRERRSAG